MRSDVAQRHLCVTGPVEVEGGPGGFAMAEFTFIAVASDSTSQGTFGGRRVLVR